MVRILDEADYRRRLDQAAEISSGEEVKLIVKGLIRGGPWEGPLNARKAVNEAKINALRQARKQLMQQIRAEDDRMRASHVIPIDVWELATGSGDELIQVP